MKFGNLKRKGFVLGISLCCVWGLLTAKVFAQEPLDEGVTPIEELPPVNEPVPPVPAAPQIDTPAPSIPSAPQINTPAPSVPSVPQINTPVLPMNEAPKERGAASKEEKGSEEGTETPETETLQGEEAIWLNIQDRDIKDVIKQISQATGRNFILDSKVTGKVTILSSKMMTREEAYQAFLSALQTAGFTTFEGPGGIYQVVPLRDAKNYPIPTHVDTTPYTDNFITRLIKLENISANEMSEAIKGLISRNGNLFAYPETNTLVLTDSGTNIDRLMKIIKELDQEGPQEVVEIVPIHFANARDLASIVLSLYESSKGGGGRRAAAEGGAAEMEKVSKIIADERTNSIILVANKRAIEKVKTLINRLDAKLEEGQEGKIHVHYLKYATAKDVASVLQGLSGQVAKPGAAEQGGAVIAQLEEFKVASDDSTNSLLITANAKTYNTLVDKVLSKLDIPRKQVYLEAMVIEFSASKTHKLGVSVHGGQGGNVLGFGQTFGQLQNIFQPFSAGSSFLTSSGLLGGILSRETVTITDASGTSTTIPAFSAFLTALHSLGETNLVASPNLLALDNEEASIEIIRKEPEPGQSTLSATGAIQKGKPERIEAGLKLKLTPQITERGTVQMKIDQQYSSFATAKNVDLGTQAIVERKVATSVVTNDGQTVVIGGLMEDNETFERSKVPLLGDIPLLGLLFRSTAKAKSKSNLLLFITPHIITEAGDFEKVLKRKMGQQQDFLSKRSKPKDARSANELVNDHNPDLFDLIQQSRSRQISAAPTGEAVITELPEDKPQVTIVLPTSVGEEQEFREDEFDAGAGQKDAVIQEAAPEPVRNPVPVIDSAPVIQEPVAPTVPVPVIQIPTRGDELIPEVNATPVQIPVQQSEEIDSPQKQQSYPPVIKLPEGAQTDLTN